MYIGPVAQAEDKGLFEEKEYLLEETVLVNKEVTFVHNGSTRWVENKHLLGLQRPRSKEVVCRPR